MTELICMKYLRERIWPIDISNIRDLYELYKQNEWNEGENMDDRHKLYEPKIYKSCFC